MAHKDSIVTVPAGTFFTYTYERLMYFLQGPPKPYRCSTLYSYGVGVVKNHFKYTGPPDYWDSKLVNYYIAP